MNGDSFPRLMQFLGAYFNEDWMCEFKEADDVIRLFISESTKEAALGVEAEIKLIFSQKISENDLRGFLLKEVCCCYCYWHEWSSGEAWLAHVLSVFRNSECRI